MNSSLFFFSESENFSFPSSSFFFVLICSTPFSHHPRLFFVKDRLLLDLTWLPSVVLLQAVASGPHLTHTLSHSSSGLSTSPRSKRFFPFSSKTRDCSPRPSFLDSSLLSQLVFLPLSSSNIFLNHFRVGRFRRFLILRFCEPPTQGDTSVLFGLNHALPRFPTRSAPVFGQFHSPNLAEESKSHSPASLWKPAPFVDLLLSPPVVFPRGPVKSPFFFLTIVFIPKALRPEIPLKFMFIHRVTL